MNIRPVTLIPERLPRLLPVPRFGEYESRIGNGAWTGVAVLVPIGAALLAAAALIEIGQLLFGLAEPTCAACVNPSQAINTAAAAAGTAGAAAAAAGAAAGTGGLGGGPSPPNSYSPDPADDVGDVTPRAPPTRDRLLETSDMLRRWAETVITTVGPYTGMTDGERKVDGAPPHV